jgi:hypothetical protein
MRHSLHSHLVYLENAIQDFRNQLTGAHLSVEILEDIELQLATAESALTHYRQAFALESSVSGSEPPNQPGAAKDDSGAGSPESSKHGKTIGLRVRNKTQRRQPAFQILPIPQYHAMNGIRRAGPSGQRNAAIL